MHRVYLALGTNLGDRAQNLRAAIAALTPAVRVLACSNVYETPPWGMTDQPAFLNQVVEAETARTPASLLRYLKSLETRLGREPGIRYGPRVIDLDILFYDQLEYKSDGLTIPHPRLAERAFVLVPLSDLAPHLVHPVLHKTVNQLLGEVDRSGIEQFGDSDEPHCT